MGCANSTVQLPQADTHGESFFDKYELAGKLGKGAFAQVRALSDESLAVKVIDLRPHKGSNCAPANERRKSAVKEAAVWKAAGQHKNVVGLQAAYLETGLCFFVMERCDESFQKFLAGGGGDQELTERALSRVFTDLLQGLEHLHDRRVVHRDIKADNVMVSGGVCKICDFGLAAVLPKTGKLGLVCGSAPYMCPEMLNEEAYDCVADIWGLGVMAYVFFYGRFPYMPEIMTSEEMKREVAKGRKLPTFSPKIKTSGKKVEPMPCVSQEAEQFARMLLNRDATERVSATCALGLRWIVKGPCKFLNLQNASAELPSLVRVLDRARKCGAFECRRADAPDAALDKHLSELHGEKSGGELSQALASAVTSKSAVSWRDGDASTTLGTSSCPTSPTTSANVSSLRRSASNSDGGHHGASEQQSTSRSVTP